MKASLETELGRGGACKVGEDLWQFDSVLRGGPQRAWPFSKGGRPREQPQTPLPVNTAARQLDSTVHLQHCLVIHVSFPILL